MTSQFSAYRRVSYVGVTSRGTLQLEATCEIGQGLDIGFFVQEEVATVVFCWLPGSKKTLLIILVHVVCASCYCYCKRTFSLPWEAAAHVLAWRESILVHSRSINLLYIEICPQHETTLDELHESCHSDTHKKSLHLVK